MLQNFMNEACLHSFWYIREHCNVTSHKKTNSQANQANVNVPTVAKDFRLKSIGLILSLHDNKHYSFQVIIYPNDVADVCQIFFQK